MAVNRHPVVSSIILYRIDGNTSPLPNNADRDSFLHDVKKSKSGDKQSMDILFFIMDLIAKTNKHIQKKQRNSTSHLLRLLRLLFLKVA